MQSKFLTKQCNLTHLYHSCPAGLGGLRCRTVHGKYRSYYYPEKNELSIFFIQNVNDIIITYTTQLLYTKTHFWKRKQTIHSHIWQWHVNLRSAYHKTNLIGILLVLRYWRTLLSLNNKCHYFEGNIRFNVNTTVDNDLFWFLLNTKQHFL